MRTEYGPNFTEELKSKFSETDSKNFNELDFLAATGSPLDAIMYLYLFWPNFVQYRGMIFRKETTEDSEDENLISRALELYGGDLTRTEQDFNLTEVPSGIFSRFASESSEKINQYLVEKMVEIWSLRLHALFPESKFIVETISPTETGGEVGILFYTLRETIEL